MPSGFLGEKLGPRRLIMADRLAAPIPTVGAELLGNPGFDTDTVWTKGTGWTIGSNVASHNQGAGTGNLQQSVLTTGSWYLASFDVVSFSGGAVLAQFGGVSGISRTGIGSYLDTGRCGANSFAIIRSTSTGNVDNASFKLLTLASLLSLQIGVADCNLTVCVTRTNGTHAGLAARINNANAPTDGLIAYENQGRVKVDKVVAGVWTNIIDGAVTYTAGKPLRLICAGNNVAAYYNGTQVGTTQVVSDASIIANTLHGLFSTYASNAFDGFLAL